MAYTGARVSKMAKRRLRALTSPESATSLHSREASGCEGAAGYTSMATLAHRHKAV